MQPQLTENLREIISGIVNVESNDTCNENANMSSMTPAGQMMKFASEVSKIYALENLVSPKFKEAHERGLSTFTIWIFIPAKLQLVCNMTWRICLNTASTQNTAISVKHKAFQLMPHLRLLFFRLTRMSNTAVKRYQHLIFIWQKAF